MEQTGGNHERNERREKDGRENEAPEPGHNVTEKRKEPRISRMTRMTVSINPFFIRVICVIRGPVLGCGRRPRWFFRVFRGLSLSFLCSTTCTGVHHPPILGFRQVVMFVSLHN